MKVNAAELATVHGALRTNYFASDGALAAETGLGLEKTRSALSYLCQIGRAMVDLGGSVYRHRELFAEPFTLKEAVKALAHSGAKTGSAEQAARMIFETGNVRITSRRPVSTGFKLTASAKGSDGGRVRPLLHADHEGHIIEAECTCGFFRKFKLTKGPCEHILALRLAHMSQLESREG